MRIVDRLNSGPHPCISFEFFPPRTDEGVTQLFAVLRELAELRPGTRVVSFNFDMGDWRPYAWIRVDGNGRALPVYLWVVPPRP